MSQNRAAPAYQEYAGDMLSNLIFRTMSLQERGLLYTLRNECWVNKQLPSDHDGLAKILSVGVAEIESSLDAVMPFFAVVDGFIICPELDTYRARLESRKNKQSEGGKAGSAITNSNRKRHAKAVNKRVSSIPSSTSSSKLSNTPSR